MQRKNFTRQCSVYDSVCDYKNLIYIQSSIKVEKHTRRFKRVWNVQSSAHRFIILLFCDMLFQETSRQSRLVTSIPVSLWRMGRPDSPPSVALQGQNCASSRVSSITLSTLWWAWSTTPTSGRSHADARLYLILTIYTYRYFYIIHAYLDTAHQKQPYS